MTAARDGAVRASVVCGLLMTCLVPMTSAQAAPAPSNAPVADSYVDASVPNANFGKKAYLRADNSPVNRGYLKFDVSGYTPGTSAALQFYVETRNNVGVDVRTVANSSWTEQGVNYSNAPAVGDVLHSSGQLKAGEWVTVDVTSAIPSSGGLVTFALTTTSGTAIKTTSREGVNKPRLLIPAPASPSPFTVTRTGATTYRAASQTTGTSYDGTLKRVVESAVSDLEAAGGGEVRFAADHFDFGTEHFEFYGIRDVTFSGAGMDATVISNNTSEAADTEPFDFSGAFGVTVRDMTVSAGGPARTTSDALDFDQGNDVLVENVRVTASRGRGIVFDGKNQGWTSAHNTVRNCQITGIPSSGIEMLASTDNVIQGCTITDVGRYGIQANKSSTLADQPNKKSSRNLITGNVIDEAGLDGINVNSGDKNEIVGNTVTNSSDDAASRDGIRLGSTDSQTCDDNIVRDNIATDDQDTKTQRYGLNVASSLCNRTVVGPGNDFAGNRVRDINDSGTATVYVAG